MTEKLLTFPTLLPPPPPPPPSPTSPDPGDGVNRSKFNFFPEQHQHKPTIKTFVQGQHARIQEFLSGGGGVQAPQLILQFTDGVQWLYYTFSFFQGGGGGPIANFYRNPYDYNFRFSGWGGGSGPPIPPLDPHMDNVAFWHEYAQTSLCGLLLSLETSNANRSIVLSD